MRIEHLRYLLEIEKNQSISKTAQKLYLGQTTLSAIVKNLEEELGFPLFIRTHSGVQTTPISDDAFALIREIVSCYDSILQLRTNNVAMAKTIPIITSPTINSALALPLNSLFQQACPNECLDFQVVPGEEVGPMIIKNDANIGVTYFSGYNMESFRAISSRYHIKTDILLEDRLYLVVSKDNPLAAHDQIITGALENQHFVILPHFSSSDGSIALSSALFSPNNRYTTFADIGLIKKAILSDNMISIMSGYAVFHNHSVDNALLKAIPIKETQKRRVLRLCLIYRAEKNLSQQEMVLLQCIREYFAQLPSTSAGSNDQEQN